MTRQQKAREALLSEGFGSAESLPSKAFGRFEKRDRKITQAVIFDGMKLDRAGDRFGLSRERVRVIGLLATRRAIGRFE